MTPSEIVARRGGNFEDTVARFARDMETLKAAGVPMPAALDPKGAPTDPEPPTAPDPKNG